MNEPTTEAGRRHVDWLMKVNVPTFGGELYRSKFTVDILAIEQEAVAKYRRAIEALDFDTDRDRAAVLAFLGEPNDD